MHSLKSWHQPSTLMSAPSPHRQSSPSPRMSWEPQWQPSHAVQTLIARLSSISNVIIIIIVIIIILLYYYCYVKSQPLSLFSISPTMIINPLNPLQIPCQKQCLGVIAIIEIESNCLSWLFLFLRLPLLVNILSNDYLFSIVGCSGQPKIATITNILH